LVEQKPQSEEEINDDDEPTVPDLPQNIAGFGGLFACTSGTTTPTNVVGI
jgi:hypothetical protein